MLKYWVWLSELKGLRNQTKLALLRRFGDPESIFYADPDELMLTEGADPGQLKLLENHDLAPADKILADCQRLDIQLLTFSDAAYPGRLKNIYDPPALLYYKGKLPLLDDLLSVAVVGTRDCTPYGVACAEKLGFGLASGGAVVVSGLAKGIDAAATRGALRAGGVQRHIGEIHQRLVRQSQGHPDTVIAGLNHNGVGVHHNDLAHNAADGGDHITLLQAVTHVLCLLLPLVLRTDHEEIHHRHEGNNHNHTFHSSRFSFSVEIRMYLLYQS